jgi:hypothetical protein
MLQHFNCHTLSQVMIRFSVEHFSIYGDFVDVFLVFLRHWVGIDSGNRFKLWVFTCRVSNFSMISKSTWHGVQK